MSTAEAPRAASRAADARKGIDWQFLVIVLAVLGSMFMLSNDIRSLRADVRADIAELRGDLDALRAEVRADIAELRADMHAGDDALRSDLAALRADLAALRTHVHAMDNRLVRIETLLDDGRPAGEPASGAPAAQ